jgi:hypothetical protein
LLLLAPQLQLQRVGSTAARALAAGSVALLIVGAIAIAGNRAYDRRPGGLATIGAWRPGSGMRPQPATDLPLALSFAVVTPARPAIASNDLLTSRGDWPFAFTYTGMLAQHPALWIWLAGWTATLGWGAARGLGDPRLAPWVRAALGILAFNVALHLIFFGRDFFLYALHWQLAELILVAGLAVGASRTARTLFTSVAIATVLTSGWAVWSIVARLPAATR